jgi:hypothetical protein
MRLEPCTSEGEEVVTAANAGLAGKDISAKIFGKCARDVILKVAGIDGSHPRPGVAWNDEIVVNAWDPIALHCVVNDGKGARTKRTLQVFKLDDRHSGSSGRFECGGISERSCSAGWHGHLSGEWKRTEERQSDSNDESFHN